MRHWQFFPLVFVFVLLGVSCSSTDHSKLVVESGFENLILQDGQWKDKTQKLIVGAERQLTDSCSASGKQAIRLDAKNPFGINYSLKQVRTDEYLEIILSYSGQGQLVLVASHKNADYFYRKASSTHPAGEEWHDLKLKLSVPPTMDGEDLNVYVWNPDGIPVYVDDFSLTFSKEKVYPDFDPSLGMHLFIDTLGLIKLDRKRHQAFELGILESEEDDYVDGILFYQDTIIPIEMRLKGDWLDHLEGKKWSFRIKVKQSYTWNGMRTFSIHTPEARDFLNEWMGHELYRELDLLAPRYGFVPVSLNGRSLGIYAWEEHFEKQLVESLSRREGPILKFAEEHFWTTQKVFINEGHYHQLPLLQAAEISSFKESRILSDSVLTEQYIQAQNLLYQAKYGLASVSDIFDVSKLAGYQALMDLTRGFHGLTWHNQRYYYNPVISRLEPIFFDAYTELGVFEPERKPISGLMVLDMSQVKKFENLFWVRQFQDNKFIEHYIENLRKASDPSFVQAFIQQKSPEIKRFELLLQAEFPEYHYDHEFLLNNARQINAELAKFEAYVISNPDFAIFNEDEISLESYDLNYHKAFPPEYVNAYLQADSSGSAQVLVNNYYTQSIWIVGVGSDATERRMRAIDPVELEAFNDLYPSTASLNLMSGEQWVFVLVEGQTDLFAISVNPYPAPRSANPAQDLLARFGMKLPYGTEVVKDKIYFRRGVIQAENPVVIPSGFQVVFEAGAELQLSKESLFLSWSPVEMNGNAAHPIKVQAQGTGAMGFTVLQANQISKLRHVAFSGLNTLNYSGWSLTGAVNFYESPVFIDSCSFTDNICEDALNIIRSDFEVSHSLFKNTLGDAFDSDFCKGLVKEVQFLYIGNDAIDFSGSQVEISDCLIEHAGDKGVSCGENSFLKVLNTRVFDANIAYASKDLSRLELDNCQAEQVVYALLAFQKKTEYGPASITATQFQARSIDILQLIEINSKLKLNNTLYPGTEKSLAKRFY